LAALSLIRCTSRSTPKPASELFLHATGQLSFPPDICGVVENANAGIRAVIALGINQ
jgi:beta-phosphoglucomutase-like phosphatase (HAD superfamily)